MNWTKNIDAAVEVEQEGTIVKTPLPEPKNLPTLPPILSVPRVAVPQLFTQPTIVPPVKPAVSSQRSASEYHYPGNKRTALVIVAYNRPDYLERTMSSLISALSYPKNNVMVDIVLSQDGYLTVLDPVVERMRKKMEATIPQFNFTHIHHTQVLYISRFLF